MTKLVSSEAILDYLQCPKRFEYLHLSKEEILPLPEGTRQKRSRHFETCMSSLLLFFLFRSMSGPILPVSALLSRWGKSFLHDYDLASLLQESHEVSSSHRNTISMNTLGVESILSFYDRFMQEGTQVIEVMRSGILVLPSTNRIRASIHYIRSRRNRQPEIVYLYTGLAKPPLRLYAWPLLAAGMLYQQDYGVKPHMILSCPVSSAGGREYRLPWVDSMAQKMEQIIHMMNKSDYYLPDYAGNCAGCPAGGMCDVYGWRGLT